MRIAPLIATLLLDVVSTATGTDAVPLPTGPDAVIVADGVADDFDPVRAAVAEAGSTARIDEDLLVAAYGPQRARAIAESLRGDYRVVVVDSAGRNGGAGTLLPPLVDGWWEARTQGGGYDPARDVTILLDVGDRSVAMDVPPSLLREAGLDLDGLERDVITKVFVPRAGDMAYAQGLADLVRETRRTISERIESRARRARAAEVFRTRTLPLGLAALAAAGMVGWLGVMRVRHARRRSAARERLASFKQEVVALSDLLDEQRERHRMLPHSDPDFRTPMVGMTRNAYDAVQDAIGRYRERWLALMDVWERAQRRLEEEWFLGTAASDEVVAMLAAADARPPLDEVAAACRAPLDALETSHERARELAASIEADLAAARRRLDGLAARGRSAAAFEPALAAAAHARDLGAADVEADPVAARGRLEHARDALATLAGGVESVEAADERRRHAVDRITEIRRLVAARRGDGWLLAEPGADPDALLAGAEREAALAGDALDDADVDAAGGHLHRAESAAAEAATLLDNIVAARGRAEALAGSVAARLEAIDEARGTAAGDLASMQDRYAGSAWEDLAANPDRAAEAMDRGRRLLDEARGEADASRQRYFRAVAALEEAERQADWAAACLESLSGRRRELDALAADTPGLSNRVAGRVSELAAALSRQKTDRARANERCREAERMLEAAGRLAAAPRPDPRLVERAIRTAESAAARGEELAAEDARLASQAVADLTDADGLLRRAASWYAEGVKADVRVAEESLAAARGLFAGQRYEDAIHAAGEAAERARLAYAAATAEAERRRSQRLAVERQRQLEESFRRMARGAGPWVISLPGGGLTGPNPWRSHGSPASLPGGGRVASGRWSRDVAEVRW